MFNKDIATGNTSLSDTLSTTGPSNTFTIKNEVPESPDPVCYILSPYSCTNDQYASVLNGSAVIVDYVVVAESSTATS